MSPKPKSFTRKLLATSLIGLGITVLFGLLQAFVLPKNFMEVFGYGRYDTMPAYFTVDNDEETVRIFSTLRGPNPYGAYIAALVPIALALSIKLQRKRYELLFLSGLATSFILFKTYSRSAAIGAVVGVFYLLYSGFIKNTQWGIYILGSMAIILCGGIFFFRDSPFIQKVVFHTDPAEVSNYDSDDQRLDSLRSGSSSVIKQPLGHGVGAAGIASHYGQSPRVLENFYLDTAFQLGVIGLALIITIQILIMILLWRRRENQLAAGLLAAFIGLIVINMLWPAWSDETLAYTWWGVAGVVLGSKLKGQKYGKAELKA